MYYAGFVVILVKKNMIEIDKHYSLIHHVLVLFKLSKCPSSGTPGVRRPNVCRPDVCRPDEYG